MPVTIDLLLAGVIGGIVGYAARVVEQWLRAKWEADEARKVRQEARQDKLDELQRTNLLELQERLQEWARAEAEMHLYDRTTMKERGAIFQLPDALSDKEFELGRRLMFLTERVRHDDLRAALIALRSKAAFDHTRRAATHKQVTLERLDADFESLMTEGVAVTELLGRVLRSYL